jgi:Protein of unknown function (DUF3052)
MVLSSPIVPLGARSRNEWLRAGQSSCSDSATNEAGVGGQDTGNEQCTRQRGTRVVAADDAGRTSDIAGKLGVEPGMVVQELGWDSDVDEAVRDAVEERAGDDLLDEDADEVIDLVLLWWRDGDGDLVDTLVDAIGPLADNGVIWVLTPKTGRPGHVEPSEIAEAAPTAGLSQTSNITVSEGWVGSRLVAPKAAKSRR